MAFVDDPVNFTVDDQTDYSLTITIGGGVAGGATDMIDFNGARHRPTVTNVLVGKGKDIRGKTLNPISIFSANGPGNFAGVDYTLNGLTKSISRPIAGDLSWAFDTRVNFK